MSALGLGCMGMSQSYGALDDDESIRTLHRALDVGVTLIDTADAYGKGANEALVGRGIRDRRQDIVLASKFGLVPPPGGGPATDVDGRPERAKSCCDASLRRLGVDVIDLYYLHRVDPNVPIEDTVGAMAQLVREGKVRFLGLSEAGPATLHRAHRTHPIAALQSEYSLWTREPEQTVLPTCRELGIGFVPFSPLGRGFFASAMTSADTLATNSKSRTFSTIAISSIDSRRWRARSGALPRSSRSRGCSRKATTSCRFRERSGGNTWRRTWRRRRSI